MFNTSYHYRSLYRPYVAPPDDKQLKHRLKLRYDRYIAYAVQMRGDLDDLPTIIYYGAPMQLLIDCMEYVGKCIGNAMQGFIIRHEHSCRWKNGKAFRRLSVEIHGFNEHFLSLESLLLIIHNYMKRICWCNIRELPLKRLLNL